jgi:hypothetical protein
MLDVETGQIWKIRTHQTDVWRWARIINVKRDRVKVKYFDLSEGSDIEKTFALDRYAMLTTASLYQFVARQPRENVRRRAQQRRV